MTDTRKRVGQLVELIERKSDLVQEEWLNMQKNILNAKVGIKHLFTEPSTVICCNISDIRCKQRTLTYPSNYQGIYSIEL